jgi:hypothetical protein
VPLALEVRNKAWMAPALGECPRRYNAVWVLPDHVRMPSPLSVVERLDVVTGRSRTFGCWGTARRSMR